MSERSSAHIFSFFDELAELLLHLLPYLLAGCAHLLGLLLIFYLAQTPASEMKLPRRYQPVRLVAPSGKSGTPAGARVQTESPAAKAKTTATKAQAKVEEKKATTGQGKAAAKGAKAEKAGSGGSGSGGNIRLEGVLFPYNFYLDNVQIKIISNFKPAVRGQAAKNLTAVVFFVVDKQGKITRVELEEKSGNFTFDQEAQRAVVISNPLPPLPAAFGGDRLEVHFEFGVAP